MDPVFGGGGQKCVRKCDFSKMLVQNVGIVGIRRVLLSCDVLTCPFILVDYLFVLQQKNAIDNTYLYQ